MTPNTPIIIGIGQSMQPVLDDLTEASSHADMAGRAALAALADAGVAGADVDTVACVRIFSDSSPAYACPFGGADKFPLAVAARIGATPKRAVYDVIGGQSPQSLVAEFAQELSQGQTKMVVIAGGEALGNMRAAQRSGAAMDWAEKHDGDWEDRGLFSGEPIVSQTEMSHGLLDAMSYYGFMETARRIGAGRNVADHRAYMADLIAPMSRVAANNPYAMFDDIYKSDEISTPSQANRPLTTPFLKNMVAKDAVNQGAAVVMTTVAIAEARGIPREKWVYLRGHAEAQENLLLDRTHLGRSIAMDLVIQGALDAAQVTADGVTHADIYSCFPCVVDQAKNALGFGRRPLTLTGGLPFFGGPGNNYTMHGICEVVRACRDTPGSVGLAHGNGGWMSKQAIGIYSTEHRDGDIFADKVALAEHIAAQPSAGQTDTPKGHANIESYIVQHKRGLPVGATLIGKLPTGVRFYAKLDRATPEILTAMAAGNLDGAAIVVRPDKPMNVAVLL